MASRKSHLVLSEVPIEGSRTGFILYDLASETVVPELTAYAHTLLVDRHASRLTVEQGLRQLSEFYCFLQERAFRLEAVSNNEISLFRESNYQKVLRSRAYRGNREKAKATVNLKLYRIYDWLVWLQGSRRLPVGTVGRQGLVTVLTSVQEAQRPSSRRGNRRERKYPLLFKVGGGNSKHNKPDAVITERHLSDLYQSFLQRYEPFVAQRNILFADIADSTGFRRGSICSLQVDQFDLSAIQNSDNEFLVLPTKQKFGYTNTFGIGIQLAYRIRQFIDQFWLPWVNDQKIAASIHKNRLFLSSRTGAPMLDRSMTQIVSKAFRQLGFRKGIGPHALRGKFTSEHVDDELAERLELGLDTSSMSIASSMAVKLGHRDPMQFYGYAADAQARQARISREGRIAELKTLRQENEQLKAALSALSKATKKS